VEYEKHKRQAASPKKRRSGKRVSPWFVIGTLLLIFVLTSAMLIGIFMIYVKTTLAPELDVNADDYTMELSSILWYQDSESGEWKELTTLHGSENRILVSFDEIPDALWQAAVSIEDERFFSHHGVDWKRTIGATFTMLTGSNSSYGGSTITQQLLKNMTGYDDNTVKRKVTEIFRALEFEKKYTKDEILKLYLNIIYLGNGCYGVQTAAQYYFGKDVSELSVAECAALIGITNNPSKYAPMRTTSENAHVVRDEAYVQNNKDRQELILDKMTKIKDPETGEPFLTEEEAAAAAAETLVFNETTSGTEEENPEAEDSQTTYQSYFVDQVFREVVADMVEQLGVTEDTAKARLYHGGYNIYTTIDPDIQEIAESVYEDRSNLNVKSAGGQLLQSGITIVDVTNGNVVAMVGAVGEKEGDLVWNYAASNRQVGSSIKPITVYAPALDAGVITMASSFDDYPVRLLNGSPWPKNSPVGYKGRVTLRTGVANSINTVAIQVVEALGLSNSYKFATENLGLTSLVAQDLEGSGALGLGGLTQGANTMEMAAAFAAFANEGVYNAPRMYVKVTDSEGNTVLENETKSNVAMKETTAYFMNDLLQSVVSSGTGSSAKFSGMTIAGKTGTTSDLKDRYFVGYTPYYAAAVWCGYPNPERISYSGNPAITMWKKVMQQVHEGLENKSFSKPSTGLTKVTICKDSGLLAGEACYADPRQDRVYDVWVASGTEPTETCNLHVIRDYCRDGDCLAGESCPESSVEQRAYLDYIRTDYGSGVTAADNAYLLSTIEEKGACTVHTGQVEPPPDGSSSGDTSTPPDGSQDPDNPTEPTEPDTEDDWWNHLLN
jgi:penicillin-binding protein 1A